MRLVFRMLSAAFATLFLLYSTGAAVDAVPGDPVPVDDTPLDPTDSGPPKKPTLTATALADDAIELSWVSTADTGTIFANQKAKYYDLRYSYQPITSIELFTAAMPVPNVPAPANVGVTQKVTLYGLDASTEYHFAIRAGDAATPTNWSGITTPDSGTPDPTTEATTLDDLALPGPLTSFQALTLDGESVRLSWTSTGDDLMSGTAKVYDLRISEFPITPATFDDEIAVAIPPPQYAGTAESVVLSSLKPATYYYFALRAGDNGNPTNWSDVAYTQALTGAGSTSSGESSGGGDSPCGGSASGSALAWILPLLAVSLIVNRQS